MKYLLPFLSWMFVAGGFAWVSTAQAEAVIDVSCILEDCSTEGWHTYHIPTASSVLTVCDGQDCFGRGWENFSQDRVVSSVTCKERGCFEQGWLAFNERKSITAEVSCLNGFNGGRCLEIGWSTYEPGKGQYLTRCLNGNCSQYGWDVIVNNYVVQRARCKEGGCFSSGWIVYQ